MTLLRNRPALSTQPRACVDGTDRIHDVSDSSRESHQCWREVGKWESFAAMMPAKFGDVMLSSQSLHHGLTVITRNERDFADLGVEVHNPWLG